MSEEKSVGMFFIALGLFFGVSNSISLLKRKIFLPKTKVIKGKIISFENGPRLSYKFCPVIEYEDEEYPYEKKQYTSQMSYSDGKYRVGDIVEIRYYKNGNKDVIYMNNKSDIWTAPLIGMSLGYGFMIIGLIILLFIE